MSKKSARDDLFARYITAVGGLLQSLVDLEEQEKARRNYQREVTEKALFDDEFTRWINSAKQVASPTSGLACADTPHETFRGTPREFSRNTRREPSRDFKWDPTRVFTQESTRNSMRQRLLFASECCIFRRFHLVKHQGPGWLHLSSR